MYLDFAVISLLGLTRMTFKGNFSALFLPQSLICLAKAPRWMKMTVCSANLVASSPAAKDFSMMTMMTM